MGGGGGGGVGLVVLLLGRSERVGDVGVGGEEGLLEREMEVGEMGWGVGVLVNGGNDVAGPCLWWRLWGWSRRGETRMGLRTDRIKCVDLIDDVLPRYFQTYSSRLIVSYAPVWISDTSRLFSHTRIVTPRNDDPSRYNLPSRPYLPSA